MHKGCRIYWDYEHHTNGHTSFIRRKFGTYLGLVKQHKKKGNPIAKVQFDYNKTVSRIPYNEMRVME